MHFGRCQSIRHLASRLACPVANSPSPENRAGGAGAAGPGGRSWAYFGFGFGAPTIAMTVPTRSAATSRKFDGNTSGWRDGVDLSVMLAL